MFRSKYAKFSGGSERPQLHFPRFARQNFFPDSRFACGGIITRECGLVLGFWDPLLVGHPSMWSEIDLVHGTKYVGHAWEISVVSLDTVVPKILILMFCKVNMKEFECCMDGIGVIFKLETSGSLMSLLFEAIWLLGTVKNPSHWSGWDIRVLQSGNFSQSMWVWLIPQGF